jgi:hypothetical protein
MKYFLTRIAQLLLKLALDESVRRVLPLIYRRIDAEVPVLLSHGTPADKIEGTIASAIADATGKKAKAAQIEAVIGLYDPVKAALHALR